MLPRNELVVWTAGNVSARVLGRDLLVIKPSGISYDDLTPAPTWWSPTWRPNLVEGDHAPSSDTAAHAYVYLHMPEVNGVVHTHSIATTSAGFAWSIGKNDQAIARDELVAHVAALAAATDRPLSVDSERLYADDAAGIAETVGLLADAGAAGCSIEDYDPATGSIDDAGKAAERVAAAAEARTHTRSC